MSELVNFGVKVEGSDEIYVPIKATYGTVKIPPSLLEYRRLTPEETHQEIFNRIVLTDVELDGDK